MENTKRFYILVQCTYMSYIYFNTALTVLKFDTISHNTRHNISS